MKNDNARNFEELKVFKEARIVVSEIYKVTNNNTFSKDYGLKEQIRRAAISIMSNISEGYERGTNKEFIQFLFIAKGSCAEVRSQIMIASDLKYIEIANYRNLQDKCRHISAMLSNFITYLKHSELKNRAV